MTAVNVWRTTASVQVYTDGLCGAAEGNPFLATKVNVLAHLPLIVAARGQMIVPALFGALLPFESFDALVDGIEAEFPHTYARYLSVYAHREDLPTRHIELVFAGWSAARQQCEAYFIRSGGEIEGHAPARKLIELDAAAALPAPSQLVHVDADNPEPGMIDVMEAQRREFPEVGGFCQVTTLTRDTITQRILRRWDA